MTLKPTFEEPAADDPEDMSPIDDDEEIEATGSKAAPPAITIHIQSWATPVIGVVMLLVGLAAGYFLRPMLNNRGAAEAVIANPTSTVSAPQAVDSSGQPTPDLMEFLVGETHHFLGDDAAPVTMIEFSDYQ